MSGREQQEQASGFRNVLALGFVSFFTDISSEMCFSILPSFLLGLPGASRALLGLIEGLAEGLSYGMRSVSGIFSDRYRRRKVMVLIGYAVSNIIKPVFSVAQSAADVLIIRVGDGIGKAVRTSPRDALLSESVSDQKMGTAFGIHRTLDQTGAILGPLLASALMIYAGFTVRDIFWLSFVPGAMALVVILFFVKEQLTKSTGQLRLLEGVRTVLSRRFVLLLSVVGLFSVGAFNYSFVLVRAQDAGFSLELIPLVYAVVNVAHTAVAIPSGMLSDKIGREKVLLIGYCTFLCSALLLATPVAGVTYGLLIALDYGAYVCIVETVQRALVARYAPSGLRGTAYGLYYLVVGGSLLVSNLVFVTLWDRLGLLVPCGYSLVASAGAVVGLALFIRNQRTG